MDTFEIICSISSSIFQQLLGLPSIIKVTDRVYRTNYYSLKGIRQIELRTYQYVSKSGDLTERYYLVLQCNVSAIMGESSVLALDLGKYTKEEIIKALQKRIYEINELRFLNIHKYDIMSWKTDRVDITKDILNTNPTLAVILCNLSFPYNYRKMKPVSIKKNKYILITESCYFRNFSRTINIYFKLVEINNKQEIINEETQNMVENMLRVEIQIKKKGIYNLFRNEIDKRSLMPFLDSQFSYGYLEKEMLSIFGAEKYVDTSSAINMINQSSYSTFDKTVLISIIRMIHVYDGLYELEKSIADVNAFTPVEYGTLRNFRRKWISKIRALGINPVTIPDAFGVKEFPSIYQLLKNQKENEND